MQSESVQLHELNHRIVLVCLLVLVDEIFRSNSGQVTVKAWFGETVHTTKQPAVTVKKGGDANTAKNKTIGKRSHTYKLTLAQAGLSLIRPSLASNALTSTLTFTMTPSLTPCSLHLYIYRFLDPYPNLVLNRCSIFISYPCTSLYHHLQGIMVAVIHSTQSSHQS